MTGKPIKIPPKKVWTTSHNLRLLRFFLQDPPSNPLFISVGTEAEADIPVPKEVNEDWLGEAERHSKGGGPPGLLIGKDQRLYLLAWSLGLSKRSAMCS